MPIQYNHLLQGFVYNNISDHDYRSFLNEEGYILNNRRFKLFTFSRLEGQFKVERERKLIQFYPPFRLVISSAIEQFITDLAQTLISAEFLSLGKNVVEVSSITVVKDPQFTDRLQVKMISPMVAYSTENRDGRNFYRYYSPWEPRFSELVRENLKRKYLLIHGRQPEPEHFMIYPNGNREQDFYRIIKFKGNPIKAWAGIYWLVGNPELIKVAYDTGLGSKNSQGLGCFEVVRGG